MIAGTPTKSSVVPSSENGDALSLLLAVLLTSSLGVVVRVVVLTLVLVVVAVVVSVVVVVLVTVTMGSAGIVADASFEKGLSPTEFRATTT